MKAAGLLLLLSSLSSLVRGEDYFARWYNDESREIFGGESTSTLEVKGQLPVYLKGDLIRLGPTLAHTEKKNATNFVDSFGRITKWTFSGSENLVTYKSAFIRSSLYNASDDLTNIPSHITVQPTEPKSRGIPDLNTMDNTDVYVHRFENSDEYLTFTDFHIGNRVHADSLHTLGNTQFNDELKGTYSGSHYGEYFDRSLGENVIVNWIGEPKAGGIHLTVYKMGDNLVRKAVGTVDLKFTPYSIHALTVAGDYAFVVVNPVQINFLETGLNLCLSCSTSVHLDDGKSIIYIFPLDDSTDYQQKVKQIESPQAFFSFHHINGVFVDDENLQLDLCIYTTMDGVLGENVLGNFNDILDPDIRNNMASFCTNVWRLHIDIEQEKVLSIQDVPITDPYSNTTYHPELMSINPNYVGKPYCYFYSLTTHMNGSEKYEDMGILKIDTCSGKGVISSFYESGVYVGEPVFVPDPYGADEDDGVLLVLSRDGEEDVSRLLILDAKDLTIVLAEVTAPLKHMFEFHGKFFPSN